jgi:hypothetical protein
MALIDHMMESEAPEAKIHALKVHLHERKQPDPFSHKAMQGLVRMLPGAYVPYDGGNGITLHVRRTHFRSPETDPHRVPDGFPRLVMEHRVTPELTTHTLITPDTPVETLRGHLEAEGRLGVSFGRGNPLRAGPGEEAYQLQRKTAMHEQIDIGPAHSLINQRMLDRAIEEQGGGPVRLSRISEAIAARHITGSPVAALQAKAKASTGVPSPWASAFADPAKRVVREYTHSDGTKTRATLHTLDTGHVIHAETTLRDGTKKQGAFSPGEWESLVNADTPGHMRTAGTEAARAHPLRFAAKTAGVTRKMMEQASTIGGPVHPTIKGTALHYDLRKAALDHGELNPRIRSLAERAMGGQADAFGPLGQELKQVGDPLAEKHHWASLPDKLASDKILEDHLTTWVKRHAHETDTAFYDRIHLRLGQAMYGPKATMGSLTLMSNLDRLTQSHSYLSKTLKDRDSVLAAVRRIGDRHAERDAFDVTKEPTIKGRAKRLDEWLGKVKGSELADPLEYRLMVKRLLTATDHQRLNWSEKKKATADKLHEKLTAEFKSLPELMEALDASIAHHKAATMLPRETPHLRAAEMAGYAKGRRGV